MFISTSTSAAAGGGCRCRTRSSPTRPARSWGPADALEESGRQRRQRRPQHREPVAERASKTRRTGPSCLERTCSPGGAAPRAARRRKGDPDATATIRLVSAQLGILAVARTQTTSASDGRCRTRGAQRRSPRGSPTRPVDLEAAASSTATRASSPTRPGSTAFANRPTEKAEKTMPERRVRRGSAWLITVRHAMHGRRPRGG